MSVEPKIGQSIQFIEFQDEKNKGDFKVYAAIIIRVCHEYDKSFIDLSYWHVNDWRHVQSVPNESSKGRENFWYHWREIQ